MPHERSRKIYGTETFLRIAMEQRLEAEQLARYLALRNVVEPESFVRDAGVEYLDANVYRPEGGPNMQSRFSDYSSSESSSEESEQKGEISSWHSQFSCAS